ncbi:hypothetical protein D3C72_2059430 [compost metagenome]
MRDAIVEVLLLGCGRQFAVEQQIADFEEVALLGQLFDRIAAVQQHAFVAVDIGDLGFAGRRGRKARVVGERAGVLVQGADVDDVRADRAGLDGQVDRLFPEFQRSAFVRHANPPELAVRRPKGRLGFKRRDVAI